jgi:excisionase family DNA binding protein
MVPSGRACKALRGVAADPELDSLYSVREVAARLGVHPETIRRLIHDGRLDAVRVGRVLRVPRHAVDAFLARQRIKPTRG